MRYMPLALLLLLVACASASPASPTLTPFPAPTAIPTPTACATPPVTASPAPSPTGTMAGTATAPTASPTPENSQRPHYDLRLSLDYAAHSAGVDERITYINRTDETLHELVLAVEPRLWPGIFVLTGLKVDGQVSKAVFIGQRMSVELAAPLAAGQAVTLEIGYKLQIPLKNERYVFGFNAHETSLLDWYPFIVPYISGKGWVLHNPSLIGEHLVYESADFDVYLKFMNITKPPLVAAGAPGVAEGEWIHYRLRRARGFALTASDRFLTSTADAGGIPVTSYYFDGHQAAGAQAAKMAAQAVALFSKEFAPYPYESLSIVESPMQIGMESDGLVFLAKWFYDDYEGGAQNYLTILSAHETAHQWWYGLVGNDQALEPWLDEALATYSEQIFYHEAYPDLLNWWWDFRVRRYNPAGFLNVDVYAKSSISAYTGATYFVGAYFFDELRVRVGEDVLAAALADYAQQYAGKIAARQDFFAVLDRHTGVDYSDVVERYFRK